LQRIRQSVLRAGLPRGGDGAQNKDAYQRSFLSTVVIRPESEAYAPREVVEGSVAQIGFGSQNQQGIGSANNAKTANEEGTDDLCKPIIGCALTVADSLGVGFVEKAL